MDPIGDVALAACVPAAGSDARLTLQAAPRSRRAQKGYLTCSFPSHAQADIFSMTHHVECVAILEPVDKAR